MTIHIWRPWFPRQVYVNAVKRFFGKQGAGIRETVKKLEAELREYLGCRYVILMPSGTTAIHVASNTLLRGEDKKEVLLPSSVCESVPYAIKKAGKELVFLEIDPTTFNLDEDLIEDKISDRSAAILVAHQFGVPCNMDRIGEVALDHGLLVIEDAAQAFGAEYKGKKCGTLGDVGVLSFNNKVVDACGGGAVVTDNRDCFLEMKRYADDNFGVDCRIQGFLRDLVRAWLLGRHPKIGFRIGEILGSPMRPGISEEINLLTLFLLQDLLPEMGFILRQRRKSFELYSRYLRGDYIQKPMQDKNSSCTFYNIRFKGEICDYRDRIQAELRRRGIYADNLINSTHRAFGSDNGLFITDEVYKTSLALPTGPWLGEEGVKHISNTINTIVEVMC